MNWLDHIIWHLGAVTFLVLAGLAIAAVLAAIVVAFVISTPRLHVGQPKNDGELCFYDYRTIITGKDGQRIEGTRRMINAPLQLKWWFGISHRRAPKWFIGIIR